MTDLRTEFAGNIERFSGFADIYDQYRPAPPANLATVLTQWAQVKPPFTVVDLGSGTGLSTRYWQDRAERIIGVEPTADMRHQAVTATSATNVSYREGYSHQTGLPDGLASIVTCSQSLHWMEPQATFVEAARILQPGGVFAAFDYDWPPVTTSWQADAAYEACMQHVRDLELTHATSTQIRQWDKPGHLDRMRASNCFRYVREILLHHVDNGNAQRLVGLLLSQGGVMTLLKAGCTERQLGIDQLRATADQELGSTPRPWFWCSRVRLGIV
ncbi:MAG TPA: class I SAM-dependent methyltransferase [Anaerolineae bacterium]|jgi:ubiquinone/menaquinone biosynthesis C-methylase UbiE